MSGCALKDSVPEPVSIAAPVVVETSHVRCPLVAQAILREAGRMTAPPAADTKIDGVPALSDEAKAKWLDAYERAEFRKNAALQGLIAEYRKCRLPDADVPPAAPPTKPTKPTA